MRKYLHCSLAVTALSLPLFASAQAEDTMLMVQLKEVQVKDLRQWNNDTARYRFNQMRYYVQTVLPYVHAATGIISEVHAKLDDPLFKGRARKEFISRKEDELRTRFEDRIKALNETQGLLLIKLIARQSGLNIYAVLNEFKSPVAAMKWQIWARLHGFNLNKTYDPADEPLLEQVMLSLGYYLPDHKEQKETETAMKH